MTKACSALSIFARVLSGSALVLMTTIIIVQVFGRYVLNASPVWAEQAAMLILIWCVFFAAAAGVREGFHIRISIFVDYLPDNFRKLAHLASNIVVAVFGLSMVFYGLELAQSTWQHVIPTLGISRGFAYIPIAISGVLITLFSIEKQLSKSEIGDEQLWN